MSKKIKFFKINNIQVVHIPSESNISAFGVQVVAGARYENFANAGAAHFAEHMFFKGTGLYDWKQQDRLFAKAGASQNAYTGNDLVMYHATFPEINKDKVIHLIMDMFFNATFPEDEMEKERQVIMEEKRRFIDDADSFFYESIGENLLEWQMGHPTIGTFETIESIKREDIIEFLNSRCGIETITIIYVGKDSDDLKKIIEDNIPANHPYLNHGKTILYGQKLWNRSAIDNTDKIKLTVNRNDITQAQLNMSITGLPFNSKHRFAEKILLRGLGGGMYSKLFSRIRQELGLCYSVGLSSYDLALPEYQMVFLYGGTAPKNIPQFMEESEKVIDTVIRDGMEQEVFECAKADLLSSTLRSTETSMGKLQYYNSRAVFGECKPIDGIIHNIQNITIDECNEVANILFSGNRNWSVMIPLE